MVRSYIALFVFACFFIVFLSVCNFGLTCLSLGEEGIYIFSILWKSCALLDYNVKINSLECQTIWQGMVSFMAEIEQATWTEKGRFIEGWDVKHSENWNEP
jgi:hypothetical protein